MNMHDVNKVACDELLSPATASKLLPETSAATLQRWARQGKIPVVKMPSGRLYFNRRDIEALLEPAILNEDIESGGAGSSDMVLTPSEDVPLPGFTLA